MNTYCLFCKGGRESMVTAWLNKMGYATLAPLAQHLLVNGEIKRWNMKRLLPGYVFLDSETEPDWQPILRISDVYRRLAYQDGEYALRSGDLAFVEWLKRYNGVLEVSTAVQVGTRLQFIQGPLKDMAGQVVKVNKKRRVAAVRFGSDESLLGTVWCSLDIIAHEADVVSDDMPPNAQ